jgi:hypothetical protein
MEELGFFNEREAECFDREDILVNDAFVFMFLLWLLVSKLTGTLFLHVIIC